MLDYKDIITKHCALGMTGSAIAETLGVSKSGVNDFLRAFKACKDLKYPLPKGITNYGIAAVVYPRKPTTHVGRDVSYELPDYEAVSKDMSSRKNMTLKVLWNRYVKKCRDSGLPCSLRQRLLQRRPSLSAQRSPHPGICCHGEDFLQRRGIYLRMAQSHRQESVVYGSKSSPGQLQGTFRVERDLFHPEGHDRWPQHRSGD